MRKLNGRIILSPTDLANHLACRHLTWLNLKSLETGIAPAQKNDDLIEVLQKYGDEHEATYLAKLKVSLEAISRKVVDLKALRDKDSAFTLDDLMNGMAATAAAMKSGRDTLYQPTLCMEADGHTWIGYADFLEAVDGIISNLGDYAFEPQDTKLARIAKVNALLQLCVYAEQIQQIQGVEPKFVHVVPGSEENEKISVRLSEVSAYYRHIKKSLIRALLESPEESEPTPNEHCDVCRWRVDCKERLKKADDLSLVSGMTTTNRHKLREVGITKLEHLATEREIKVDINPDVLSRLKSQANLQYKTRIKQNAEPEALPEYEFLLPIEHRRGFNLLPERNLGDIFYDIEGHAYRGSKGLEYLHGLAWIDPDGSTHYIPIWAHNTEEERDALIRVIDFINERIATPGQEKLRIYHYGNYEPSALKRLAAKHATYETKLSKLLREGRFVDLSRVVTEGMRIGVESYSIKKLEKMYHFERNDLVSEGKLSIVCYEEWLSTRNTAEHGPNGDGKILEDLRAYNEGDCLSTIKLREWLEEQRETLAGLSSNEQTNLVRPEINVLKDEENIGEGLAAQLNAGRFDRQPDFDLEYRWLLADLLDFHGREKSVNAFEFIQRRDMTPDELFKDSNAISGLHLESTLETASKKNKHSEIRRYRFVPQSTTITVGKNITAPNYHPYTPPDVENTAHGIQKPKFPKLEVVSVNYRLGIIDLRLTSDKPSMPDPTSIFLDETFNTQSFTDRLHDIARSVIDGKESDLGVTIGLLKRQPTQLLPGSPPLGAVERERDWQEMAGITKTLDGSYLAVQGPPGTGKTYSAARMILDLVRQNKRVGITAQTFNAVDQLLEEIVRWAGDHGFSKDKPIRVISRTKETDAEGDPDSVVMITKRKKPEKVEKEHLNFQIICGNSFFFARPQMRDSVDVLFVDEAGQLSLADTLAVSLASKNLVLVGDPQQLKQTVKAAHPGNSGLSALEYINNGTDVVPEGYGILLSTTKRMHPAITEFISEQVYEGKLHSVPGLEHQAIGGTDWLAGSGLRWFPVPHAGRTTVSEEEAFHVVEAFYSMLDREFTDKDGLGSKITPEDVFLIAPYNAQCSELLLRLADHPDAKKHGVTYDRMRHRVGTVDRAQGDEAPIVLYSFTSSSKDDIPRGMDFLYSKNRFNVAVSRAQALVVVFASPHLLDVTCKTIEQVRLANMLLRYVEVARSI